MVDEDRQIIYDSEVGRFNIEVLKIKGGLRVNQNDK